MRQLLSGNHMYFLTGSLKHCSLKVQVLIRSDKCSDGGQPRWRVLVFQQLDLFSHPNSN